MAKEYIDILFPVGRMVYGDVTNGRKRTDAKTNAVLKNQDGTDRIVYALGHAVKKGTETHWNQTAWGKLLWDHAVKQWPNGQYQHPQFAFKIVDGDSTIPNKKGRKPVENEGYAGHWVINLGNSTSPQLTDRLGKVTLTDRSTVVPGRYIQPFISTCSNESQDSPGMFLNLKIVALSGWGPDIVSAGYTDTATVGFGGELPQGASEIPQGQATGAPAASAPAPTPASAAPAPTAVAPASGFSNGPAAAPPAAAPAPSAPPPQPVKRMTAKATTTYEEYIKAGWSDQVMIDHGILEIA